MLFRHWEACVMRKGGNEERMGKMAKMEKWKKESYSFDSITFHSRHAVLGSSSSSSFLIFLYPTIPLSWHYIAVLLIPSGSTAPQHWLLLHPTETFRQVAKMRYRLSGSLSTHPPPCIHPNLGIYSLNMFSLHTQLSSCSMCEQKVEILKNILHFLLPFVLLSHFLW